MNDNLVNRISEFLSDSDNELFAGKPATTDQIEEAEKTLNVSFDKDYKQFLELFGGSFVGFPVYGFNNCDMLSQESVLELTQDFRTNYATDDRFPIIQNSYVISMDGNGDPIIINEKNEIVIYYHDNNESEVISKSFEELIENNFMG